MKGLVKLIDVSGCVAGLGLAVIGVDLIFADSLGLIGPHFHGSDAGLVAMLLLPLVAAACFAAALRESLHRRADAFSARSAGRQALGYRIVGSTGLALTVAILWLVVAESRSDVAGESARFLMVGTATVQ